MSKRGKRIDDNTVFQRVGFGGPMRRAGFRPFIFFAAYVEPQNRTQRQDAS